MNEPIGLVEHLRRRRQLAAVRHSTELEGGRSTEQARADQDAWAAGEISLDELGRRTLERIRARNGA